MRKKQNSTTKMTLVIICLVTALVGYYAYLSNRSMERIDESNMSAVQSVLSRDLVNDYPATPKEVMKYYNEIMKCFYNEECTDQEIDDLGQKARELYDEELLEANELGTYMIRLRAEIQSYKDNSRRLTSSSVAASTSVKYYEADGYSFARILCGYNIMEGRKNYAVRTVYLLRRDEDRHWKIYGWEPADNLEPDEEAGREQ